MRLLGIKTCDTCRKARKALSEAGREVAFVDVREDGLSEAERAAILAAFGEGAINRASATWRGLSEAERALPAAELLARHPVVMKRPVIEAEGRLHLGWGPEVRAALLGL